MFFRNVGGFLWDTQQHIPEDVALPILIYSLSNKENSISYIPDQNFPTLA
jgi:hypothetical protein